MKIAKSFPGVVLILVVFLHTTLSAALDKPAAILSDESSESSEDSKEESNSTDTSSTVKPETLIPIRPLEKALITSGSDTVELKAEHKAAAASSSDENLGTSATIPVGFTPNGIFYSPFRSGAYAGLGHRPFGIGQHFQGAFAQGYGGDQLHAAGHGYNHILPKHGQYLHGGYGGYRQVPQFGFGHGHGQYLAQGQRLASHAEVVKGYPVLQNPVAHEHHGQVGPAQAYGGVAYAGHGAEHDAHAHHVGGYGQQHVTVNKQTQVGVGPYGEIHRGDTIQKTLNTVEGATPIGTPFSPYGHGGVVYMGNGLISEHAAGVHTMGPVLPPPGYQQQNIAISKQAGIGPYGEVQTGVTLQKEVVNSLGHGPPYQEGGHQQLLSEYQPQGFQLGSYQQQEHGIINKQAELGVDAYGNVNKGVAVQKAVGTLGGPDPGAGLGYNGQENHVIAHQDQAFVHPGAGAHGPGNQGFEQGYSPDPYFNNQVDPIYRRPPPVNLLTTGPNRYYQGKNPVGVYDRYNRLG